MAMSRNFTMLCEANWKGLDFESILRTELEPFLSVDSDRVRLEGEKFTLSIKSTKDASMIFRELVTNAVKHGFLSIPKGQLHVVWNFDGSHLNVRWNETGLDDLQPPTRAGFGLQMIELFPNLGLKKSFEPDGIKFTASIPAHIVAGQIEFGPGDIS